MIGSLFSGIGGIELGLEMCGLGPVVWQCDNDPHARAVLATHWPTVHRFTDVKEIGDEAPPVEIICGGFPCQDISLAGKGAGIDGTRSGLWSEYARIVRALRPAVVFVENVAALVNRGLDRVLRDLAALGFDAEWDVFRASDVGAPHRRERVFLLAYSDGERVRQLAERGSRGGTGERKAEREHAESLHDRAALADPDGFVRHEREREPGREQVGGTFADWNGAPSLAVADAMRGGCGPSERNVRAREPDADRRGEGMADADGAGWGSGSRSTFSGDGCATVPIGPEEPGRRGGFVPDADGSGREGRLGVEASGTWRPEPADIRPRDVADSNGDRREGIGRSSLLDGERPARGDDADRRQRAHRFPPGPDAIAGWDGPQPAIRNSHYGLPRGLDGALDGSNSNRAPSEELRALRESVHADSVQRRTGVRIEVRNAPLLFERVLGARTSTGVTVSFSDAEANRQDEDAILREVRRLVGSQQSSQGSELAQQRAIQLGDALLVLSHLVAPRGGRDQFLNISAAVFCLWKTVVSARSLRNPSKSLQEVWRPETDEEATRWIVGAGLQYLAIGRSHRLRLLGNSVVPQQAALAWRTLSARITNTSSVSSARRAG